MHQLAIQIEALKGQEAMVSLFRNAYAIVVFFFSYTGNYMFKVNKRNVRTTSEISKSAIQTPDGQLRI